MDDGVDAGADNAHSADNDDGGNEDAAAALADDGDDQEVSRQSRPRHPSAPVWAKEPRADPCEGQRGPGPFISDLQPSVPFRVYYNSIRVLSEVLGESGATSRLN